MLRVKLNVFSLYDVTNQKTGCQHEDCVYKVDVDLFYVFRRCPAAQELRKIMTNSWLQGGINPEDIEFAMFGLKLPQVPDAVWRMADDMYGDDHKLKCFH